MHVGEQEFRQVQDLDRGPLRHLYHRLADREPDAATRAEAAQFLRDRIARLDCTTDALPADPRSLADWMERNTREVHARYAEYLAQRRAGAPRRFFSNRAHALYVLRSVAPTKLVDGAWLYGLLASWNNPRLGDLVRTYVEELGEGAPDKNHVVLYRGLLARYALDPLDGVPDDFYEQGVIQLALAWNAQEFLPEAVGFNLGYEQLPLHLLVTAYELNELGLDPYYFTLHVTVDNGGTGHARRACQAVLDMLPRLDDGGAFWARVRAGCQLSCAGAGTTAITEGFDIGQEALAILARKATAGDGAHSQYCRVAGRSVNEWLREPGQMPAFIAALEQAGWIRFGAEPRESRFWRLLQGERAEMFGVFSAYELQVLHDWMRGDASADGRPFDAEPGQRRPTFRALARNTPPMTAGNDALDPDVQLLHAQLARADGGERSALLVRMMSPAQHWTPAGLEATRMFWQAATR